VKYFLPSIDFFISQLSCKNRRRIPVSAMTGDATADLKKENSRWRWRNRDDQAIGPNAASGSSVYGLGVLPLVIAY
jgi:hypothetical protein